MSALYCRISESARMHMPTARAHTRGTVEVMNWGYRISATMISSGGDGADRVCITITNLNSGWSEVIVNEAAEEIWRRAINAPAT